MDLLTIYGVDFSLTGEAVRTNRVFHGWWGDAKTGESYTDEWSMECVRICTNQKYKIVWHFEQTKGAECDDDDLPWHDVSNVYSIDL